VLFGRIVDVLSGKGQAASPLGVLGPAWAACSRPWGGIRPCSPLDAVPRWRLHADRLAHRQAPGCGLTDYFEHIMQLPLTFHTGTPFRPP